MNQVKWWLFLKDIFLCALASYGGPEAHYGIFSSILVEKRGYLTEEELTEMIGLFALVPGPSSTQTITAIGYHVGGPILSLLTFLVWVLPAMLFMALIGVFFSHIDANARWQPILTYLPTVAVAFIVYAAVTISKKVIKNHWNLALFLVMLIAGLGLVNYSVWMVPVLLVTGGVLTLLPHFKTIKYETITYRPKWSLLIILVILACLNEGLKTWLPSPWITLYTSFYRYGYSVIGGGQVVIPLMIQDLVETQALLTRSDFLSGYAIDQAIPGPLFSFAAFVSARSFVEGMPGFLAGMVGGMSIFLPGTLLVYFIFPLWRASRQIAVVKHFLKGVTITAASIITLTGVHQILTLSANFINYILLIAIFILLLFKKVPVPLLVFIVMILGFIF